MINMKFQMRLRYQTVVVLCYAVLSSADRENGNKHTKLWSLSSASNSDGSSVVNVTSASIVIPSSYSSEPARASRVSKSFAPYAFRPRAIPLKRIEETPQEKNVYYTQDNKYKTEILFPGNYFAIPKEKSMEKKEPVYNPLSGGSFEPQAIPLIRSEGAEKRSLDLDNTEYKNTVTEGAQKETEDNEEILPEPLSASRRSLSYILGADDEEEAEEDEEDGEYETEDDSGKGGALRPHKIRHKLKRAKKYSKYMTPLLLAYKLKYFALVPVMIGGLILLVGATGMAGFFFALFAAVMGLQKGGY